jgi:hypothetical protein
LERVSIAATTAGATASSDIKVDRIEGQTIYFTGSPAPKPLKTELYDLSLVGTLRPEPTDSVQSPYFLFAANPCPDCASEKALYLIRPPTRSANAAQITSFVYPGKVIDPKTHRVVLESRAFVGRCLRGIDTDHYVVFQKERVDRRHQMQPSVFIAQASNDYLKEKLLERGLPSIKRTLRLVKSKSCHEIAGRSRIMPLKPRGLNWRNLKQGDDEDDSDDQAVDDSPGGETSVSETATQ